jgi:SAM-dependent methyltransferase
MSSLKAKPSAVPINEKNQLVTEQYYSEYHAKKGADRNDLLRNPEVLFQVLAADASLISGLRFTGVDPSSAKVLDIGCGDGTSLLPYLRLGFEPSNLHGVDIRREQIRLAQERLPGLRIQCSDATRLDFPDGTFDIVQESMMFLQMTHSDLSQRVAGEMLRVTRCGGYLLLSDWRYGKMGSSEFKALDRKRIERLFYAGSETTVRRVFRGSLVPPVGRFLSKNLPSAYFIVRGIFPFLTGQVVTVLQRNTAK